MRQTWDSARVTKVLKNLEGNGATVQKMGEWAGVSRSTLYRWKAGTRSQPDYHLVNDLGAALWRRGYEDAARELVEAAGYVWAEPADEPEPLVPPNVLAALEEAYGDDRELLRRAVEAQEAIARARRAEEDEGRSSAG